jgi:hypothetical protein
MSYFRTIPHSSVPARGVLTSTTPKCDVTGTAWFAFLRWRLAQAFDLVDIARP